MTTLRDLNEQYERSTGARAFLQLACAKAAAWKRPEVGEEAIDVFRRMAPRSPHLETITRAATSALTTDSVAALRPLAAAFIEIVAGLTVIGRLSGLRKVPALTRVFGVTDGTVAGSFVREGEPIPVAALDLDSITQLRPGKVAIITPFTRELFEFADPLAFSVIERDLTRAIARGIDDALLDGGAAVTDGRPASILNGVSAVGGGSPSDIEGDITSMFQSVRNGEPASPAFVTSMSGALYLATLRSNGERLFPDVGVLGGSILGVPLLITPSAGAKLILVDAGAILYADGGVSVEPALHAALQLSDAPSSGAQQLVSMFQANTVALRGLRYLTWVAADDAVAFIDLPVGSPF